LVSNPFDLSKKFPNYSFDKRVFRVGFLIILLLWFVVYWSNGFVNEFVLHYCPESSMSQFCLVDSEDRYDGLLLCRGCSVGSMPNSLYFLFYPLMFIILLCCFLFNHFLFWRRKRWIL
jgi:hypothetical protein